MVSGFQIVILRTFFADLPESLIESAKIDGASEMRIFWTIIIPLSKPLKKSRLALALYGVFAGVVFSCIMDVWSVLWYENGFHPQLYWGALLTAVPYMSSYAVSNVIFLLLLGRPFGEKLERIKIKYGV